MVGEIEGKIKWLLILFPGFLSFALAAYISDMEGISEFEFTIYSLVLSVWNVALSLAIYRIGRWLVVGRGPDGESKVGGAIFIVLLLAMSCATGVVIGVAYERDWLLTGIRQTPGTGLVTRRSYQRPLTFLLAQNRRGKLEEGRPPAMKVTEAWVQVGLNNGDVFEGYPEFFTTGKEPGEIFLSPACRQAKWGRGKAAPIQGPGILIFEREIRTIEFVDRPKSECHEAWKKLAGQ